MGSGLKKLWTPIRDTLESAASLAGNYLLPGSSLLTGNLVSKGSQEQLNSTIGKIANIGTGLAGAGIGSSFTGIPAASSLGAGWSGLGSTLGLTGEGSLLGTTAGTPLAGSVGPTQGSGFLGGVTGGTGSEIGKSVGNLVGAGTAAGGSGMSSLATGSLLSNGLSAFLGRNANDDAEKKLLAGQQAAQERLAPYATDTFNPGDLTADPGYQFQLKQGQGAIDAKNAATGGYYSGAALKDAADYSANLAGTTYNNAYQRWLSNRNANYGTAQDLAGIDVGKGNTQATADVNNSNVLSRALSNILGGSGFTNTGASSGNSLEELMMRLRGYA